MASVAPGDGWEGARAAELRGAGQKTKKTIPWREVGVLLLVGSVALCARFHDVIGPSVGMCVVRFVLACAVLPT